MTLSSTSRTRLFALAGSVLAIALGAEIANEAFFWPVLCAAMLGALIVMRIQSLPVTTLLLGALMLGYIVGNRGFAQVSLAGRFPLLPAEFVLATTGVILMVQSAWRRELPVRRDALNGALLIWMLIGSVRLLFDVRTHGFAAIRDYAVVYYAAFFFISQHAARETASARVLEAFTIAGCGFLLVIHPLFAAFPSVFLDYIVIRGVPLIFYKDDLAGNFMAMGSLLFFVRYERSKNALWLGGSLGLAGLMLATNSRSSMVGLAVGAAWLAFGRRWRFAAMLTASGVVAALGLLALAHFRNQPWEQTPVYSVYERAMSIADPLGQRAYQTDDSLFKGDNNLFRIVWWRSAIEETIANNPWFGLGFGYDLAAQFVRQYLPEAGGDFTARSPHNVVITLFARTGAIGCVAFLAAVCVCAFRTVKSLRAPAVGDESAPIWCAAWVILTCACFGVVLEGPMGAVVFWILLGLANGAANSPSTEKDHREPGVDMDLPSHAHKDALLESPAPTS